MSTKANSVAVNLAGVATATATAWVYFTNAHDRIYAITIGLAVLAVLISLTMWNLARGGSAALGILKLTGRKTPRPRAPRQAAPPPASASRRGEPPAPATAQPTSRGRAATAIVFALTAGFIAYVLTQAVGQSAAGATAHAPGKATTPAGPASVVYAYYAAVNNRDWPKAWTLSGRPAAVNSAAYNHWVDGYACTVRDQVTSVTKRGAALAVSVRAEESGGVIQSYRFSYIVRDGVLTHPEMLSFTGHAPQGCGK